jgi:hypothetical protein
LGPARPIYKYARVNLFMVCTLPCTPSTCPTQCPPNTRPAKTPTAAKSSTPAFTSTPPGPGLGTNLTLDQILHPGSAPIPQDVATANSSCQFLDFACYQQHPGLDSTLGLSCPAGLGTICDNWGLIVLGGLAVVGFVLLKKL